MGTSSITYNDRVRYKLQHKSHGSLTITEPEGWQTDEKEYTRHKTYHGILTKFSNSLKFHLDGAEHITFIKDVYGINDNIRLIRDEKHPHTDIWERSYSGNLDLSTYRNKNGVVSVKFNSSGLEQKLKARESEKVEVERLTSMDGVIIPELVPHITELKGRKIFLRTTFAENETNDSANSNVSRESGEDHIEVEVIGLPVSLTESSHENAHSVIPQTTSTINSGNADNLPNGDPGMMLFAVSDVDRVLDISLDFTTLLFVQRYENIRWAIYRIQLTLYSGGTDYVPESSIVLYNLGNNHSWFGGEYHTDMPQFTQEASFNYNGIISIPEGYSLALEGFLQADMDDVNHTGVRVFSQDLKGVFKMEEISHFDTTTANTILSHDLGKRLIQIITGRDDAFYSEILGRQSLGYEDAGEASLLGFTHGFWVRGFNRLPLPQPATQTEPEIINKYKGFTTSFKDFRSSMFALWNLGLGIEKIGFKERVRMEKKSYFYNKNVLIRLPNQVQNIERSVSISFYYSAVEVGYMKGGVYEEAMGLDEYNAKSTFTTVIHRLKKTYLALSKYRADSYGKEFARRKQITTHPTEDTSYDNNIFAMDLKASTNTMLERLWQDDFEQAPTGVFSPETATNLRISPFNMMLRHGWAISSGFTKYLTDYVRYGSSTANSELKTKLIGGNEYAENGNIINSELQRPIYLPEWIEFEHEVDFDLMKQVEGTTTILGKEISNFYGLVEFINENGDKEKGFLFNLKPNGKGRWKLLKAFK